MNNDILNEVFHGSRKRINNVPVGCNSFRHAHRSLNIEIAPQGWHLKLSRLFKYGLHISNMYLSLPHAKINFKLTKL